VSDDIPPSLSKFESELERAIKRELERPRAKRSRPRVLVGTTLGLAGLATALALALTAASSSPAFAVTRNRDGTVSVRIMRLSGLDPANAKLAAMNVRVKFEQVRFPCRPQPPRLPGRFHPWQTLVKPWRVPRGRTLVIKLPGMVHTGRLQPLAQSAGGARGACVQLIPPPCAWRIGKLVHAPRPPGGPLPRHARPPMQVPLRGVHAPRGQVPLPQPPSPNCKAAFSLVPAPGH
jgi:hypothetical protein